MAVFNFNQSAFPILSPQQASPLGGVLSDAIAKRLAAAQAQKAEAQAPLAGVTSLADALSKIAYSQIVGPQAAMKFIGNERVWPNLRESQRTKGVQDIATAAGNLGGNNLAYNLLQAAQSNQQSSPGLFDGLLSLFGVNKSQNTPEVTNQNMQGKSVQTQPIQSNQDVQPVSTTETNVSGVPKVPQTLGEQPTSFQNEAYYHSQQAAAAAQGAKQGEQLATYLNNMNDMSQSAQNMAQTLQSATNRIDKVYLQGPGLHRLKDLGADAVQLNKELTQMGIWNAGILYGNGTTNAKDDAAASVKLLMSDPIRAKKEFGEKMAAESLRMQIGGQFVNMANEMGITDKNKIQQIWFNYNNKYPAYDYKNHKPLVNNIDRDENQANLKKFIVDEYADLKNMRSNVKRQLTKDLVQKANNDQAKADRSNNDEGIIEIARDQNGKFYRK
jgi:hypothetical protein